MDEGSDLGRTQLMKRVGRLQGDSQQIFIELHLLRMERPILLQIISPNDMWQVSDEPSAA